jgi:hypothetical protein
MKLFIEHHRLGSKEWFLVSEGLGKRPMSIPLKSYEEAEEWIQEMFGNISATYLKYNDF